MTQLPVPQSKNIRRMWLRVWVWGALVIAMSVVLALGATVLMRRAPPAASPQEMAALTQRCQTEMLRGTCSAMNVSAPKAGVARLFIAGVGEVDAVAFAALRAAGNAMCTEAAAACTQDWNGNTCRITRALYPAPLAGSAVGTTDSETTASK